MPTEPSASASVRIAAEPRTVYALVTDLATLTQLAEETERMRWERGDAAAVGARFRGENRNGARRWTTSCTVTAADPGREFAFAVVFALGPVRIPVARWSYRIEAEADGCRVVEGTWDERPRWFRPIAERSTGVRDRTGANVRHIERTLARLKARAEA